MRRVKSLLRGLGERGIIDLLTADWRRNDAGVVQGPRDDCAVFEGGDDRVWLVTSDLLAERIHFLLETATPEEIGHKALAVNLSDIAAMGGTPRHALLSLAIPAWLGEEFILGFRSGLDGMAEQFGVNLLGGDLSRAAQDLVVCITVLGEARAGDVLYRRGARAGDRIYVTGPLGDAAAGLECLARSSHAGEHGPLERAQLTPTPRVNEGLFLAESGVVTSCIDLSDGLATDLAHICRESAVGAVVSRKDLPLSRALTKHAGGDSEHALRLALGGGEDYELCFTVGADGADELEKNYRERFENSLHLIGEVVNDREGVWLKDSKAEPTRLSPGFDHFAEHPEPANREGD